MNKRGSFLRIFIIFTIVIILINTVSALGISPGKIEFNFQPGLEQTISYRVFGTGSETELRLYIEGDLAQYVKLDKEKLIGGGGFIVILKLPEYIEKPGKHRILIGAREIIDEELVETMIGTSINIRGVIEINVPYPGKYIEITLKSHNVNVGEPVRFELEINNKGKETVIFSPKIEISSQEKLIETLYLKERVLKSQETIKLYKVLDTTDYNPGTYTALAVVDYGKVAKAESSFKIGELFINITNTTKQIIIGGIQRFDIEIESGWNDKIEGVYAEVSILNTSDTMISFKTSPTSLTPWEKKTITGFFDTANFKKGFYDVNITLIYYGKDVGKSSSELVKIEFIKKTNKILIWYIIGGIILLGGIVLLIKKYLLKNVKKKIKKK